MHQLEMRVAVDEARQKLGIGKMQRLRALRRWHLLVGPDRRDSAARVNKNGAVLDGWRRHRMHAAGSDAKHVLSAGSSL